MKVLDEEVVWKVGEKLECNGIPFDISLSLVKLLHLERRSLHFYETKLDLNQIR
jgi:hypothetical protein